MRFSEVTTMPPVYVKFTHSKAKYEKWIARFGGKVDLADAKANTACLRGYEGGIVFFVWMTPCIDYDAADDAGLLAHEAVHIADDYFAHQIFEKYTSDEEKAYVVQSITSHLVKKHFKWKKKRLDSQK